MRVLVTGGGTGGHIYPMLALIKRMKERGELEDVLFVGSKRGLESDLVPKEGIDFKSLEIQGFKRKLTFDNFKTLNLFFKSVREAKKMIKEFKPDVVIGSGGYVSGAVVYAASRLKVPTIIHEQNSVVGITNKFLSHFVTKIAYVFDGAATQFSQKKKLVKTGNPRSQEVAEMTQFARLTDFGLENDVPTVLVFGGSQGSKALNDKVLDTLDVLNHKPYQVMFVTGRHYYNEVKETIAKEQLNVQKNIVIMPYIDNMTAILPEITAVVSRSGATTIAELTAVGTPSILIPSPNVTHDHQTKNAQDLEKTGAAVVIAESDLNDYNFVSSIDHILLDASYAKKMSLAAKKHGISDASDKLIELVHDITQ